MVTVTKKIGPISAYAIAKEEGYTGTKAQFAQEIGNAAANAQAAAESASAAEASAESAAASAAQAMSGTPEGYATLVSDVEQLKDYNNYNFLPNVGTFTNGTNNGATYTWNNDKTECTINSSSGTTDWSYNTILSTTDMSISGFVAGETYLFDVSTTNSKISIDLFYYQNGSWSSKKKVLQAEFVQIPNDATGIIIRAGVANNSGALSNEKITVSVQKISDMSAMLKANIESNSFIKRDVVPDGSDLNNITVPGIYILATGYTYSNKPSGINAGMLLVFNTLRWTTQYVTTLDTNVTPMYLYARMLRDNDTWINWYEYIDNAGLANALADKQDTISDLSAIRDGANKATALSVVLPSGNDDTSAIQTALNTYKHVQLTEGEYTISSIDMPSDSSITGVGNASVIVVENTTYAIKAGARCELSHFILKGPLTSKPSNSGNGDGILITGDELQNIRITNLTICGFRHYGIKVDSTGLAQRNSVTVSNCEIFNCYTGISINNAEFGRYIGCLIRGNAIGVTNLGGNNSFIGCSIGDNTTGFNMSTGDNNGHGIVTGCTFNHNTSWAIIASYTQAGFIFSDCQIWYGKIFSEQASGIMFNGCTFGTSVTFTINSSSSTIMTNCAFKETPTIARAKMNGCYLFDGTLLPTQ